jgi:hypothetical protein
MQMIFTNISVLGKFVRFDEKKISTTYAVILVSRSYKNFQENEDALKNL